MMNQLRAGAANVDTCHKRKERDNFGTYIVDRVAHSENACCRVEYVTLRVACNGHRISSKLGNSLITVH